MNTHFPLRRAITWMVVLMLLALPATAAFGAEGDPPILPLGPAGSINHYVSQEGQVSAPINPTDVDRYLPAIAYDYDHGRHLVVWHDAAYTGQAKAIRGQLMDDDSAQYGINIFIATGSNDRVQPAVAYNGTDDKFLVVYMYDELGTGQKYEIKGRFVNIYGSPMGSEFTIESVAGLSMWSPQVAWNSQRNEYMVVWGVATTATPPVASAIGMRALDHDGASVWGWIVADTGYPNGPSITYDKFSDHYLVVWNFLNVFGQLAVKGDLRYGNGNHLQGVDIYGSETLQALNPKVTNSLGIFYAVVWEVENSATDHDIHFALVTQDGLSVIPVALVTGPTNDTHPDIAGSSDRFEYSVVFQRADVNGAKIYMLPVSGYLPLELIPICDFFGTDCTDPAIIYGGGDFISAFLEDIPSVSAGAGEEPSTPFTVQHVFEKIVHTQVLYLPQLLK